MPLHHPLIFVWPEALLFWVALAWIYLMEGRQLQRRRAVSGGYEGSDKYSGLFISIGSTLLQLGAVALAYYEPASVGEENKHAFFYTGLVVLVSGTLLRMHCWKMLGEFFTHTVTIASNHQVINIGAYRFLRHPAYLGGWLNLIGLGLIMGNFASLALITIGGFAIFHYRITVEEQALESALGEQYRQFMQSRKRLIPFVY
ncbi:MAG: isoprenylcysteine carboxylmethyltransferase family protein [Aquabacterium sp.]